MAKPILVVGGHGFFGRAVVDDLLDHVTVPVVVGGRHPTPLWDSRLAWKTFNLNHPDSVSEYSVVVCCAGPYQGLPTTLVQAAADAGVPYIDLADDRDFIRRARRVSSEAIQLIGLSVVPGLTVLLSSRAGVGKVHRVRTLIAPGSRPMRGGATMASVLSGAKRWSGREMTTFSPPIGRRAVYRTIEVGDADIIRELFNGADFEFKVGFDSDLFNRGMELIAVLCRWGLLQDAGRYQPVFMRAVNLLSWLGTDAGGVRVEVSGSGGTYVGLVTAPRRGDRIPSVLAAIAAERIISNRFERDTLGAWLPELDDELKRRGIEFTELREGK